MFTTFVIALVVFVFSCFSLIAHSGSDVPYDNETFRRFLRGAWFVMSIACLALSGIVLLFCIAQFLSILIK